jgi:hypothetical protein
MIGVLNVQKLGMSGQFATGWFEGKGFIADERSPNGIGNLWDAVSLIIPSSGEGRSSLRSFSVIASGKFGPNPAGDWVFNIAICHPLPPITIGRQNFHTRPMPRTLIQELPKPSASASVTVGANSIWLLEADVTNIGGTLSGTYSFSLDGSVVHTGDLVNLPQNLNQPICAMLQIGQQPPGASVSDIILAVSLDNGYTGNVVTLNL